MFQLRRLALSLSLLLFQVGCPKEPPPDPSALPNGGSVPRGPLVEPLFPDRPPSWEAWNEPPCGLPGEPECPLQAWMDRELNIHFLRGEFEKVAEAFAWLATMAPEELPTWTHWTSVGIEASLEKDRTGIEAACAGCHRENRPQYRRSMRLRPLPPPPPGFPVKGG